MGSLPQTPLVHSPEIGSLYFPRILCAFALANEFIANGLVRFPLRHNLVVYFN